MDATTQAVLDAFEVATMGMAYEQRMRVLEDSIALYRAHGYAAYADALAERLESAKAAALAK